MVEEREFVGLRKVADHFKVSESTIRAWIRNGSIPENTYIKVGKTFRFELNLISDALLGEQPRVKEPPTQEELNEQFATMQERREMRNKAKETYWQEKGAQEVAEVDLKDVLADLDEDF
jgi:hypothetical protein|tara:strand:+ start:299 stop:655 length:357 start_codon:yes stop_codon:yes gene_type:complete